MESISSFSLFWQIYILVLVGIIGLIFGSFLNVVALRLLSGESIVFPGSKCPKCQKKLSWYDNIPVISYLMLLGKCRNCKTPISFQYPMVEIAASALFLAVFMSSGFSLKTLLLLILTCALIVITVTDFREKVIFDITITPFIPLGLVYNFFDIGNTGAHAVYKIPYLGLSLNDAFISAIIGAIIGAAFFEIFSRVGLIFVGQYAFGGGDTLIGAALGAWFGWKMVIVILVLSFIVQLIAGVPIILTNMYKDKDYKSMIFMGILLASIGVPYIGQLFGLTENIFGALFVTAIAFAMAGAGIIQILKSAKERQSFTFLPFGPALVLGGFIVMFYGPQLLSWYAKGI